MFTRWWDGREANSSTRERRNGKKRVQGLGHKINGFQRHGEDLLSRAPRADYQVGQSDIITNPSSLTLSEPFPDVPSAYPGSSRAKEGSCAFRHLVLCNYGWKTIQAEQTCCVSEDIHRLQPAPLPLTMTPSDTPPHLQEWGLPTSLSSMCLCITNLSEKELYPIYNLNLLWQT